MAQTFEEMCKARDPLYAAMKPAKWYATMRALDLLAAESHAASTECLALAFMISLLQHDPEFVHLEMAL